MSPGLRSCAFSFTTFILALGWFVWSFADDFEATHELTLADLTAYRAALSDKATASNGETSEPSQAVSFKQLWAQPDVYRGHHVTVQGRIQRIFRQGPVGSFPPLAEIWITSPAGDPFCLVVPQKYEEPLPRNDLGQREHAQSAHLPKPGLTVRFTGTFLKLVRFAAGDGARLAPLIVGDQPPAPVAKTPLTKGGRSGPDDAHMPRSQGAATWLLGLTLALCAAGMLVWRLLHTPSRQIDRRLRRGSNGVSLPVDPPLEFVEPDNEP